MGLACLTEAVNKGCCCGWTKQPVHFEEKGLLLHGLGDWKAKGGCLECINMHVDQQYLSGFGLVEGEQQPIEMACVPF